MVDPLPRTVLTSQLPTGATPGRVGGGSNAASVRTVVTVRAACADRTFPSSTSRRPRSSAGGQRGARCRRRRSGRWPPGPAGRYPRPVRARSAPSEAVPVPSSKVSVTPPQVTTSEPGPGSGIEALPSGPTDAEPTGSPLSVNVAVDPGGQPPTVQVVPSHSIVPGTTPGPYRASAGAAASPTRIRARTRPVKTSDIRSNVLLPLLAASPPNNRPKLRRCHRVRQPRSTVQDVDAPRPWRWLTTSSPRSWSAWPEPFRRSTHACRRRVSTSLPIRARGRPAPSPSPLVPATGARGRGPSGGQMGRSPVAAFVVPWSL